MVLPSIISNSQAAFIHRRRIGDNILVAQELFRNYHRATGPPRCALKVDLSKAFDSLSWDFLFRALALFKFPPKFCYWIKACISSSWFSVKVNGTLCGHFRGAKGLRQGDPLSPYLFALSMEVLSLILAHYVKQAGFKFHWKTKDMNLTHLMFADDLLLFCHGDTGSVSILKYCLDLFSRLSGLGINKSKSSCLLANVTEADSANILAIVDFPRGSFPVRFLGVPLITTKLTSIDCQPLLEKIRNRICSWTNNFLSYAGRVQLIKSVIMAMQGFWASHFFLPSRILKDLQQIMSRFLWRGTSLQKFGAKISWKKITFPFEEGGLSIKDLREWNKSLLLLQLLKLINPVDTSLWVLWIRTFQLKGKPFWLMATPQNCSWTWRKILSLRSLALRFLRYEIGNGESTALWTDPWLFSNPLASSLNCSLIKYSGLSCFAKVSDIIVDSAWRLPTSNHHALIEFRQAFDLSKHCDSTCSDQIFWDLHKLSEITAKIIWTSIRQRGTVVGWANFVWLKYIPPRHSFLLWLAFMNGIRTKDRLINFGLPVDPTCVLCHCSPETFSHLFFNCPISFRILVAILRWCGWRGFSRDWTSITSYLSTPALSTRFILIKLGLAMVVYSIWQERNSRLHGAQSKPLRIIIQNGLHMLRCRARSITKSR